MSNKKTDEVIEGEVLGVVELQRQLNDTEMELAKIPAFQQFISLRKEVNDRMGTIRANVEAVMVPAYQRGEVDKTIKGDWGSVTVTESDVFDIDELSLAPKFWKKVPDTTKIRATFQLEGKAPKGTVQSKKYGITMRFK